MATQNQQSRHQQIPKKRVIHQLDTPFATVAWPDISSEDQETILELLCSLLAPIGLHRQEYVQRSKGKRAKREANRKALKTKDEQEVPPEPPMMSHVDVGFNCITKNLEVSSLPRLEIPPSKDAREPHRRYSVVFVTRGDQSAAFNSHFPQMIGAASKSLADTDKIRLVGFSKACSERLSLSLGVPRVSSVAIVADAPGATALQTIVRSTVPAVDVPWLPPSSTEGYQPTKINSFQTTVGNKKTRVS